MEGGHEVPEVKITERYGKSPGNLLAAVPVRDRIYVYDNSVDKRDPEIRFRTYDGRVAKVYVDPVREWAEEIMKRVGTGTDPNFPGKNGWDRRTLAR